MAKVLFLFVETDEEKSKKLRDYLQVKLGTRKNLTTVKEALAEGSSLQNELNQSRCIVLISSKKSLEFIKQGKAEKEDDNVLFDGGCIQEHLRNGSLQEKLVVVQFVQAVSTSDVPEKCTSDVPEKSTSDVPEKCTSHVPKKCTSHVPEKCTSDVPEKCTSDVPEKCTSHVPAGYDTEKVYLLDENYEPTDAVLNQIEDAVKGILTMKVKEDKME